MRNIRFHLLAIAIIIFSVTGVFYALGHFEETKPTEARDEFQRIIQRADGIQIIEANWGLNCVEYVRSQRDYLRERLEYVNEEQQQDIRNTLRSLTILPSRNNVLELLQTQCNGKTRCEVMASADTLSIPENLDCPYRLEVVFRCMQGAPFQTVTAESGKTLSLICKRDDIPEEDADQSAAGS